MFCAIIINTKRNNIAHNGDIVTIEEEIYTTYEHSYKFKSPITRGTYCWYTDRFMRLDDLTFEEFIQKRREQIEQRTKQDCW